MRRAASLAVLLLLAGLASPATARAQVTRREVIRVDTSRARPDTAVQDTTRVGRGSGIPQRPTRQFQAPDSVVQALLRLPGFTITRYSADSVQLLAEEKEIRMHGAGLVEREGSSLEAEGIRYVEADCQLLADGSPKLFDRSGVLVGEGMRYDACNKAGVVEHARTDLPHGGGTWYMIGDMAVDNAEDRVYAAGATITSCELEEPHYHFATRQVKWVSKRLMVSRPAVLYVADVPIAWLPFVFQDTRRGRRSGVLPPQVGINDIVRFNAGYQRHITNVGYYWAISDFMDAQTSLDWYAGRSLTMNGRFRYRWLDRFMAGGVAIQKLNEYDTRQSSFGIHWNHEQQFSLNSQLTAGINYVTSSRIVSRNSVDPILAVGTIDSRLNYQRRFAWGSLNVGGSRSQQLDKPQVTMNFPTITFTPNQITIARSITWSPSVNFTNTLMTGGFGTRLGNTADTLYVDSRSTTFSLGTPIRFGSWIWQNNFSVQDNWSSRNSVDRTGTGDSVIITSRAESFSTAVDWQTGIGLPVLFQGSWNFQPAVQIVNTAPGAFLIRNERTNGGFVANGKRLQFSAATTPTFFGLFPGFGPVSRIRHAISPVLAWAYSPAATVPQDYADAIATTPGTGNRNVPARHSLTLGLSQNFEAKLRPPVRAAAADSAAEPLAEQEPAEGRKVKILSIQSDAISYDFEQAKLPGRSGWVTQQWGNTISSDLVRGLNLRFTTDLWEGPVGYDSTRFSPYLTSVATGFSLGAGSLNLFRRILGLRPREVRAVPDSLDEGTSPTDPGRNFTNAFQRGPMATQFSSVDRLSPSRGGGQFSMNANYSLQRTRPTALTRGVTNSMLSGSMTFSPTAHWTVSWQTSYNFTQGQFADHVVRLDRDLHDWRATFSFIRSPNGNFSFSFFIELIDEPDLKFAYDQRNLR